MCRPLGPVEFAERVLGIELWPSQRLIAKLLYGLPLDPGDLRLLEEWREGDPEFGGEVVVHPGREHRELVLVCGMRASKTWIGSFFASYESYKYLSLPDPWKHYGIYRHSPVFGMIAATSRETARDTVFEILKPMLQNDFFEACGLEVYKAEARFPSYHFTVRCGASSSAALVGRTDLFVVFDELDQLPDTRGRTGGHAVYAALSKGTTTLDGLNISLTSPLYDDSMGMELLGKSKKVDRMMAIRLPTWMINPSPNEQRDSPKIAAEFLKDPEGAARDYGALPIRAISPFFRDRERLLSRFMGKNAVDGPGVFLEAVVVPNATYAVAGDPSAKNDAFGVALGHRKGEKITIDLAFRFVPDPSAGVRGEVNALDVKSFFLSLTSRYPVETALFDTYMFMEVRQALDRKGVEVLQNHVLLEEYQMLKNYVYSEGSSGPVLVLPDYPPLKQELLSLERHRGRIDHPSKGSKDVADAVAQVVAFLSKVEPDSGILPQVVY